MLCELKEASRSYRVRKGFFARRSGRVKALDAVSLAIRKNEIVGLVGESGCGKSTLARIMLGLEPPDTGAVFFDGVDLASMDKAALKGFRKRSQMVFQDPFSSLNPRKTVYSAIREPLLIHNICDRDKAGDVVAALLSDVGLDPGAAHRYPHEFSGGQRQRIGVARALATGPDLIVADEPTSALDVSIQAQIINLLLDLQEKRRISMLFISHDLPVVRFVSRRIAVMYRGQLMEIAPGDRFGDDSEDSGHAHHPYTSFLLEAVPLPDPELAGNRRQGRHASGWREGRPDARSEGCAFAPRCAEAAEICFRQRPVPGFEADDRMVACHAR
jgi:oligopeptide/dipeptide ABC transporter ATP-binding protein